MAIGEGEFDVSTEEGEDGGLEVKPDPVPPPDETSSAPPDPPPRVTRIGRPPKRQPAPPPPADGGSRAPNIDITKRGDEWPKDLPGLWMHTIQWAKENGRGPDALVIYVHQMRGPTGAPMQMSTPIYGEQVMGGEEQSAGDALIERIIDDYHLPTTMDAATYRIEIRWRATGGKIKTSEPFPFDKKERIERLRYAAAQRRAQAEGGGLPPFVPGMNYGSGGWPTPSRGGYGGPPPQAAPAQIQPQLQQAPVQPAPPPTGNLYLDQYIAEMKERADRLEADVRRKDDLIRDREEEIRDLRPVPMAPAAPVVESEDTRNAKLAAMIAQTMLQTMIQAGVIKKPGSEPVQPPPVVVQAPAPVQTPAQQQMAVANQVTSTTALENLVEEVERIDKVKKRMRKVLGLPEEEEEEEEEVVNPPNIHLEPAAKEMKTYRIPNGKGGFIELPRYEEDDEVTTVQKVVNIFAANPEMTRDVIGNVMGVVMTKLSDGPLANLIGQLLTQGGAGAVAAQMARAAVTPGVGGAGSA